MNLLEKIKEQAWDRMPVAGRWVIYPLFSFMAAMVIYSIIVR